MIPLEDFYRTYRIHRGRLLGISRGKSDQDIHELIESGFMPKEVYAFMQLHSI